MYVVDAETYAAIAARPTELIIVSAERIATELRKIFLDDNRATGLALLRDTGLLSVIFPETNSPAFERAWQSTLQRLAAMATPNFASCLALIFRAAYEDGAPAAAALVTAARRQKVTNRESQLAEWLIANEATIANAETEYWPTVQRLLLHDDIENLLRFATALHSSDSQIPPGVAFCRAKLALAESEWNPAPLLDGHDLRDHGVPSVASVATS